MCSAAGSHAHVVCLGSINMLLMQCAAVKELYGSLRTEHEGQEDAIKAAASALASLQEDNKALRREVEQLQAVNARQVRESAAGVLF